MKAPITSDDWNGHNRGVRGLTAEIDGEYRLARDLYHAGIQGCDSDYTLRQELIEAESRAEARLQRQDGERLEKAGKLKEALRKYKDYVKYLKRNPTSGFATDVGFSTARELTETEGLIKKLIEKNQSLNSLRGVFYSIIKYIRGWGK